MRKVSNMMASTSLNLGTTTFSIHTENITAIDNEESYRKIHITTTLAFLKYTPTKSNSPKPTLWSNFSN